MQTGRRQGMITMAEALAQLAREGRITRQTAVAFAQDAAAMESRV